MDRSPREIAYRIVNQAISHEDAIETKISLATLLIGIEHEIGMLKASEAYALGHVDSFLKEQEHKS